VFVCKVSHVLGFFVVFLSVVVKFQHSINSFINYIQARIPRMDILVNSMDVYFFDHIIRTGIRR
jgi:hypothetical protein